MTLELRAVRPVTADIVRPVETTLLHGIDAVAADAEGLLEREGQQSMYNRLDWLRSTARYVLPDERLLCARMREADDRAWLFLAAEPGRRARAFASWYTLDVSPAFTASTPTRKRMRLLTAGACALRRHFDRIDLQPVAAETVDLVREAFSAAGWWAVADDATANWVADTEGLAFEEYWRSRPSRLKNTVRRKLRDSTLEIRIVTRFDPAAWADYEAVYAQSWKPEEGSPAFLRAFAESAGNAGCMRLALGYRDGRPVASQFWTVDGGVATIHKLAYVESERTSSPGTQLSHAMFRHVLDRDRPGLIDYGNGDEPYKSDWMTRRQVKQRITLFNRRSLMGVAGAARSVAAELVRRTRHD